MNKEPQTFTRWQDPTIEKQQDEIEDLKLVIGDYVNIVLHDRKEIDRLNDIIKEAIELTYNWGEALNPNFQKQLLEILRGEKNEQNDN